MMQTRKRDITRQWSAFALTWTLVLPLLLGFAPQANAQLFGGNPQQPGAPRKGMSTGKKVALLGGAALLYFLFKKNQAKKAEQEVLARRNAGGTYNPNTAPVAAKMPQLYRSKNGGIYYRDANANPVWLTVPSRPVQVSTQDLQRYAPDYNQYQGPAPSAPHGYRTQPFEQFDTSAYGNNGGGNNYGGGSAMPPGPRY